VAARLLLDEMLTGAIAEQLRARGHDVTAVVEEPALTGLSDDEILAAAAADRRTPVTANITDFVPLDQRYRARGRTHNGIVLVSAKTFPQDRAFVGALVAALDGLLSEGSPVAGTVVFLQRA
jgi:NADPH-dependent 2,4-dienoyl-CoA reductase/sulfur reductase-like enzyme